MKKPINLILLTVAVAVWLFTLIRLVPDTPREPISDTSDLPEIPDTFLAVPEKRELLALDRDPFSLEPIKPKPEQSNPVSEAAPPRIEYPSLEIILIFERENQTVAVARQPGTLDDLELTIGTQFDHWEVTQITLESVTFKELESGEIYQLELP